MASWTPIRSRHKGSRRTPCPGCSPRVIPASTRPAATAAGISGVAIGVAPIPRPGQLATSLSTKAGAVSEPALGRYPSMKAESFFLEANDEYVADIHRGYSTAGAGKVDTVWALVWHFTIGGKVDRVVNLSGKWTAAPGRTTHSRHYPNGLH